MPIIPQLGKSIKLGKSFSGGLPAEPSADIDTASQGTMAGTALQPAGPALIPVIPVGIALAFLMTKLEALVYKSFEELSKISQKMMEKYNRDLEKATSQREAALTQLNNDLKTKQQEIKDSIETLKTELDENNTKLPELQEQQESEMGEYEKIVFGIRDEAYKLELEEKIVERDIKLQEIRIHDDWLAEIIKISTDIITLKLRIVSLENEITEKEELAQLSIPKEWETDVNLADQFEVPVPYYPDLPPQPSFPTIPPIPKIPEIVKAMAKAAALLLVTPTLLPTGVTIAGILLYIRSLAPLPPDKAADTESDAESKVISGGGAV
jgi:uncharacterized membrane-anchored protein YhcB (DUF1043 family)